MAVTLTLNTVIPFFHRTLQLTMLHYQTKFGCKPTSSLEYTTETVISPHCNHDIEHSDPILLQDTLAYDAAYQYQVW